MSSTSLHVTERLSDYCLGNVPQDDASRIAEHLLVCRECHAQYDDVKLGVRLAKELRVVDAPDAMWSRISSATRPPLAQIGSRGGAGMRGLRVAASIALLITGGAAVAWTVASSRAAKWTVAAVTGIPTIGSTRLQGTAPLVAGDWLVTDSVSTANVTVGRIGNAEIAPGSRLRLVRANPTDHRMALERGSMHAKISAPPRLFVVETPTGSAIDLGCEYTLDVDASGASRLSVDLGWVALTDNKRQTLVPAGAVATSRPGIGVSIPYYQDASVPFRNAVLTLDDARNDPIALTLVLNEARRRDALTLWHIVPLVEGDARDRVVTRLATLVPLPAKVSRAEVMALDDRGLDRWLEEIEPAWAIIRQPVWQRVVSGVWEYVFG